MNQLRSATSNSSEQEKWNSYYAGLSNIFEANSLADFYHEFGELIQGLLHGCGSILEAGCGAGLQSLALARLNKYSVEVMDFSPEALNHVHRRFGDSGYAVKAHLEDVFQRGKPRFDLVFNAGVLEHYTLHDQARFLRGMASRSRRYVLVLVPNRLCYWYWIWRLRAGKNADWPFGKECPSANLRQAFELAGLTFVGQTFLGRAWTEDLIAHVSGLSTSLREDLLSIHRSTLVEPSQACYLLAGLGSVLAEDGTTSTPCPMTDQIESGRVNELTAALTDALAMRLSAEARLSSQQREFTRLCEENRRLRNMTIGRVGAIARRIDQAHRRILPSGSWRQHTARVCLNGAKRAVRLARRARTIAMRPDGFEIVLERRRQTKRPVIMLPSIAWSVPLFQRPQHLARQFAQQGHLTIYDCSYSVERIRGFKEIEPNLFLYKGPASYLQRIADPLLWSLPYNVNLSRGYSAGASLIYDWIDDLSVFTQHDQTTLAQNHREALVRADVVAAVARRLHDQALEARADAIYLPNAVDFDHFNAPVESGHDEPELRTFFEGATAVAGYYGAFASWFDYALLNAVALARPNWRFLLIGPDYDGSLAGQAVLQRPNVACIGPRSYQVLPRYLRRFDVAMIPFVINDITRATSPLKLFEYFAGGKPVVTTPMPECMAWREVRIANNTAQFCHALDAALVDARSARYRARVRAIGEANSWKARVDAAIAALEGKPTTVRHAAA